MHIIFNIFKFLISIINFDSVRPAPFLIFDEVDAALDRSNIDKIVKFFIQLKSSTQIIFSSHHDDFIFKCADAGIGVNFNVSVKLKKTPVKII